MATPKLRFNGFDGDWETKNLLDVSEKPFYGMNSSSTDYDGKNKYLRITDIDEETRNFDFSKLTSPSDELEDKYLLSEGDMVFVRTGASVGKTYLYKPQDGKVYFAGFLIKFRLKKSVNPYFVFSQTRSNKFNDWVRVNSVRSGQPGLNAEECSKWQLAFTSIQEQDKIASFLTAVDTKIDELIQKHELLTDYKKGMIQQIFSQKLRFQADDGNDFEDWDDITLGEISSKSLAKNKDESISEVLTNSATQGVIKQSDYFERDIVTTSNLKGYYVVKMGDFVYNPRISSQAPVGPIKRNKQCLGVMSPLYTVFTLNEGNITYLEYFFESSVWHDYVKSVSNSGARHDRMNIKNQDFFDMPILYPCLEEQTKIANFLTAIDQKINNAADQIDQAKTWKKGLLQQMFV